MAQLKGKKEELTGNLSPNYLVQKSDPLVLMRSVPFSLGELKILDTYISRINAADDTRRTVIFTKEEYEELMGLSCVDYRTLQKHTKGVLSKVVELQMPNKDYLQFVLFERAYYHKDEYGKPIIELTCTQLAQDLFFCINKYHYFRYALENIIKLTRKASYLLYLYIRRNRFRGEWDIDLVELRDTVLDCKKNESYQEYKVFKRDVLVPAVKEVNEKTDCHFEYEAVKRGRRIYKIKFIYTGAVEEQLEQENSHALGCSDDYNDNYDNDYKPISREQQLTNWIVENNILGYASGDNEFSLEQIMEILSLMTGYTCPKSPDPIIQDMDYSDRIWMERTIFLDQMYARFNRYATQGKIKNRFSYFKKMIESEVDKQR